MFEAGLGLITLTMFELKSNSIGLASTKNAKLQIAQAMKQKCIFCCSSSLIPNACNAEGKLTRVELLTQYVVATLCYCLPRSYAES